MELEKRRKEFVTKVITPDIIGKMIEEKVRQKLKVDNFCPRFHSSILEIDLT